MAEQITIKTLVTGPVAGNCYIVFDENKDALVIDPGDEADKILAEIDKNGVTVSKIVLTHGHFDHTSAVPEVKAKTGAEVLISEKDFDMTNSAKLSLAGPFGIGYTPFVCDTKLKEGDTITVGTMSYKIIETPGHTKGSICLIGEDVIFSGDTLFLGSCGRTDFPGGSFAEMKASLKRLAQIDGNYYVYSGHGPRTTLDFERKNNPYMED